MSRSLSSRAALVTGTFVTAGVGYATMAPRVASANAPKRAVCVLTPDNNSGVNGVVHFTQSSPTSPTSITARITGLTDGAHGFHVHAWGNLTQGCTTAGPHYNPFNKTHGGPKDEERHVGDLGNIHSSGGVATYSATDSLITLHGEHSIIGRSMVVHADQDDLGRGGYADSKTTGHAGGRKYVLHTPLLTSFRVQTPRYTLPFTSRTHHIIARSFSTYIGKSPTTPISTSAAPSPTAASVAAPSQHIPTTPIVNGPRATITDDVNRPPPSHFTKTQTERAAVVSAQPKRTSPRKKKLRGKIRDSDDERDEDNDEDDDIHERMDEDDDDDERSTRQQQPSKAERWKARLKSTPQAKEQRLQRARERELDRERAKMRKASKERDMF